MTIWPRAAAVAALTLCSAGCLPVAKHPDPLPTPPESLASVQVRYLGVAGFFIRLGGDVVMTAPLYSNPNLLEEGIGRIHPDRSRIERLHFKNLNREEDVRDVRAILVGHAHYDHLMDVPYVWVNSPAAKILGSVTMTNVLAPYRDGVPADPDFPQPVPRIGPDTLVALNGPTDPYLDSRNCARQDPSPDAADEHACSLYPGAPGRPYELPDTKDSRILVRAFCARHPKQFPPIHQGPGCQPAPLAHLPTTTNGDYLEGEPIVYLVDFLDRRSASLRFRIYFQDVPSDGRFGKIPDDILQGERVDLALLCAGNWSTGEYHDADTLICALRPRHVLIGHWEDFFKPQDVGPLSGAPFQNVGLFDRLVRDRMAELFGDSARSNVVLPRPQLLKVYEVPEPHS